MSKFFVTCARGVEELTEKELLAVGATSVEKAAGGVYFEGDQDVLYRAHLWLRTGNRVLLPLRSFPCRSPEDLYENVKKFKWETFLAGGLTFAVDCTISGRNDIRVNHSHYARLKAKDAIADRMREKTGTRPDVNTEEPGLRVVLYIRDGVCALNIDATGFSLHERGYRPPDAPAPLKETLAAAILQLAEWDLTTPLIDPMCGSGTLLAEAALIATDTAPGLLRHHFAFMDWPDFHAPRWDRLVAEAESRRKAIPVGLITGFDRDPAAVKLARKSLKTIGMDAFVKVEAKDFALLERPEGAAGMLLFNPPYGERLEEVDALIPLYQSMGDTFKKKFAGWRAGVFTGSSALAKSIGLKTTRRIALWNGPIECRLLTYTMFEGTRSSSRQTP